MLEVLFSLHLVRYIYTLNHMFNIRIPTVLELIYSNLSFGVFATNCSRVFDICSLKQKRVLGMAAMPIPLMFCDCFSNDSPAYIIRKQLDFGVLL